MTELFDVTCPACWAPCWVNNGDSSDLTQPDREWLVCWLCQQTFAASEEIDDDDDGAGTVSWPTYETPNGALRGEKP